MTFLLATACTTQNSTPASQTDTFIDDYQRSVEVPLNPIRIVSTSPAVTEIMYALKAEQLLVGRTDYCVYPPQAQEIPSIGGISNLNVEKIVSLNPDLVISGSMIPQKSSQQLEQMGIPIVCVIEKQRFDGLYENISKIGQLVGRTSEADSLVELMKTQLQSLTQRLNNTNTVRPSVYYVVGFGPSGNFTAGGNSFINDIIDMAGGRNIAADITGWSYSLEALMQADPDYIMIRREDSATFCRTQPYNRLKAVKQGNVIALESGTIDLQVPRNLQAILYISQKLKEKGGH
jgi:iron complex transport system substrate-binding protein